MCVYIENNLPNSLPTSNSVRPNKAVSPQVTVYAKLLLGIFIASLGKFEMFFSLLFTDYWKCNSKNVNQKSRSRFSSFGPSPRTNGSRRRLISRLKSSTTNRKDFNRVTSDEPSPLTATAAGVVVSKN